MACTGRVEIAVIKPADIVYEHAHSTANTTKAVGSNPYPLNSSNHRNTVMGATGLLAVAVQLL